MKTRVYWVMVICLLSVASGPVSAHHGSAAFDMQKSTTVKGTVTKFEFVNPHALIFVDVTDDKGNVEHWVAETYSNNHLGRIGWNKEALKPGDQVTVVGHRPKNGTDFLELQCAECSVTPVHMPGS